MSTSTLTRIESLLFEGAPSLYEGALRVDPGVPGMGLTLSEDQAARFAV